MFRMLSLILVLKQQFIKFSFIELINGKSQTNRDQKSNLFFLQRHDQSQKFWIKLVKNRKKYYKSIDMYYIGYIAITKNLWLGNIHTVNPLYLFINHASGYIEEKNGNKYLVFDDSVYENKELLKNTQVFGMELKIKSKQ